MHTERKRELRHYMLAKRLNIRTADKQLYDEWVCRTLFNLIMQNGYKVIHVYLPMKGEINLYPLIKNLLGNEITVVCPKTLSGRKLNNLVLSSLSEVKKGIYGTLYPAGSNEYTGVYDLIIVPGLAYDASGYRLGYGGGYYDGFLASQKRAKTVGAFYPFQKVDTVPTEPHDVRLDTILVNENYSISLL